MHCQQLPRWPVPQVSKDEARLAVTEKLVSLIRATKDAHANQIEYLQSDHAKALKRIAALEVRQEWAPIKCCATLAAISRRSPSATPKPSDQSCTHP